jgi:hypothetical protein
MDFDGFRATQIERLRDLAAERNDLPLVPVASPSTLSTSVARWQAQRWIDLAEKRMAIPSFIDFGAALGVAKRGQEPKPRYPVDPYRKGEVKLLSLYTGTPTPAQTRLNNTFDAVQTIADDILAGLGDVLNTQAIVRRLQPALVGVPITAVLGPWPCAGPFYFDLAAVSEDVNSHGQCSGSGFNDWAFIDKAGAFVIPSIRAASEPGRFSEGLASLGNRFVDKRGNVALAQTEWWDAGDFHQGIAVVWNPHTDKAGFIDRAGNDVTAREWDAANAFSEGLARVARGRKWGFIDTTGRLVVPLQWDIPAVGEVQWDTLRAGGLSNGRALVQRSGKWGFIDRAGAIAIPLQWDDALPFHEGEGLAAVSHNGKWGFINPAGKLVIPAVYDEADSFFEGLASVRRGDTVGYIDESGKMVVVVSDQCQASGTRSCTARQFSNNLAWVTVHGRDRLIERIGEVVTLPEQFPQIFRHSEHTLVVEMKQTYRGRVYSGKGFIELAAR